ncbi:MAG: diguanylate cyclase, partial [Clostridiales bacterium]
MKLLNTIKNNKNSVIGFAIVCLTMVFIIVCFTTYHAAVINNETNEADKDLINTAKSNITAAQIFFEDQQKILLPIAASLNDIDDLTDKKIINYLNSTSETLGYERMAIDFPNGISYTSDGYVFNVAFLGYSQRIEAGESFIRDVTPAIADGAQVISIFSPIYNQGKPVAALRSVIKTAAISKKIGSNFYSGNGYFHILDNNGKCVACSKSTQKLLPDSNFLSAMEKMKYKKPYSYEKLHGDIATEQEGYVKYYDEKNNGRFAYYAPMNINNWMMISIVPKSVSDSAIKSSLTSVTILISEIIIGLILLFTYLFWLQRQSIRKATLDEKCFRVLSEQTGNVTLEWDFIHGKVTNMQNFENIYGDLTSLANMSTEDIMLNVIHPDDLKDFFQTFRDITKGANIKDKKFRLENAQNLYIWCTLSGVVVKDNKGKPYKVIGSMKNIDKEEKEVENLRDKAQRDSLTGLYNKLSTGVLADEYIILNKNTPTKAALLMIDLDNFKGVNDNLGHQFGDKVLVDTGEKLKKIFRTSDVLGRVGGDEFLVFIKDIIDIDFVREKAEQICTMCNQTFYGEIAQYNLTASVGIAIYPQNGTKYNELYKNADIALYEAKHKGKNMVVLFNSAIPNTNVSSKPAEDTKRFIASHFSEDLHYNIFEMLYETKDIHITINMILSILGKRYNIDRCYICQLNFENMTLTNTYEWCATGIKSQIANLQDFNMQTHADFFEKFNEDGILYCNDTADLDEKYKKHLEQENIKALLNCAIFEADKIIGLIGFDDCQKTRIWSGEEIANLGYVARILSIFLIKKEISQELMEANKNKTEMLDNMEGYIYAVDINTYELLYVNKAMEDIGIKIKNKCYESFLGKEESCAICPVKLLDGKKTCAMHNMDSVLFKSKINVAASKFKWTDGRNAALICCRKISLIDEDSNYPKDGK